VGVAFRRFQTQRVLSFARLAAILESEKQDDTLLISSLHMIKSFFAEFSYTLQDKISQGKPGEEGDRI